ncbi:hypothetical protein AVEN_221720-1 [Araneus ventricosus]|uniref:Uncharacterized protein n=1 Tax=Araneus ventricosus TaxID=182803 RepID=A0A4Y2DYT6_ARAVE|nr:hypothetical protein AVEN_20782-1 [Araneus ventricosus]GBM21903.1 hypothetical protein AVEN_114374-1 [Araneus ventricosus]GBM21913.1 hypothetical protein AVEN_171217-1 [Araneus ventricosus]GBM21921.1 hypothetical protein AVEN_221720-1 [Araneus ventricosus]
MKQQKALLQVVFKSAPVVHAARWYIQVRATGGSRRLMGHLRASHRCEDNLVCILEFFHLTDCIQNFIRIYNLGDNQKTGSTPPCCSIRVPLNDSHCNSSSTKAGGLVSITGRGPTSPLGGTYYHWREDPSPPITIPRGSEFPLTYPATAHIRVLAVE